MVKLLKRLGISSGFMEFLTVHAISLIFLLLIFFFPVTDFGFKGFLNLNNLKCVFNKLSLNAEQHSVFVLFV